MLVKLVTLLLRFPPGGGRSGVRSGGAVMAFQIKIITVPSNEAHNLLDPLLATLDIY